VIGLNKKANWVGYVGGGVKKRGDKGLKGGG